MQKLDTKQILIKRILQQSGRMDVSAAVAVHSAQDRLVSENIFKIINSKSNFDKTMPSHRLHSAWLKV